MKKLILCLAAFGLLSACANPSDFGSAALQRENVTQETEAAGTFENVGVCINDELDGKSVFGSSGVALTPNMVVLQERQEARIHGVHRPSPNIWTYEIRIRQVGDDRVHAKVWGNRWIRLGYSSRDMVDGIWNYITPCLKSVS